MKIPVFICAIASLLTCQSMYALKFDATTIFIKARGGETALYAQFKFANDGNKPVKIVSIKPSCGCTTAKLEKKNYAPKEEGVITAAFSVGDREGFQSKTIAVTTDEGKGSAYVLTFNAEIPRLFTIEPRLLFWQYHGSTEAQTILVNYEQGQTINLLTVKGDTKTFQTEIRELPGHAGAKVLVAPKSTLKSAQSRLTLIFGVGGKRQISKNVFLKILPDPSSVDPLAQTPPKKTGNP